MDIVGSCKFYPTAKAEWADVKQGVINVEQQALLGGSVRELLDALQSDIAGGIRIKTAIRITLGAIQI